MSPVRAARDIPQPALYGRIGYRSDLEFAAFERLAASDLSGCRQAFAALLDGLDLSRSDGTVRQVAWLLADVLQKLNRRVHRKPADDADYQANRVRLIEQFAACRTPDEARRRFDIALDRLLAGVASRKTAFHPLVAAAISFIEQNYQRRIFLSSVAQALNISSNYLSRLFRRETGSTLTTYIQRMRLDRARVLLAEEGQTIAEIAYRVGYQNYRDFYRNFTKYENASPRQVRRHLSGPGPARLTSRVVSSGEATQQSEPRKGEDGPPGAPL